MAEGVGNDAGRCSGVRRVKLSQYLDFAPKKESGRYEDDDLSAHKVRIWNFYLHLRQENAYTMYDTHNPPSPPSTDGLK